MVLKIIKKIAFKLTLIFSFCNKSEMISVFSFSAAMHNAVLLKN